MVVKLLGERSQKAFVKQTLSKLILVNAGVPLGSELGPILLVILQEYIIQLTVSMIEPVRRCGFMTRAFAVTVLGHVQRTRIV